MAYATAAEVLRMLAGGAEPIVLDGNNDPFRGIFRMAAEACEILDAEEQDRLHTRQSLDDIRALLVDVAQYLDARQAPSVDGVDVVAITLSASIRQALDEADWDSLKFPGRVQPGAAVDELEILDEGDDAADAWRAPASPTPAPTSAQHQGPRRPRALNSVGGVDDASC